MSAFEKLRLSPWYLNTRRLRLVTGKDIAVTAQMPLQENSAARVRGMHEAALAADDLLRRGGLPSVTRELLISGPRYAAVFGSLWGVFTFSGVSLALRKADKGEKADQARMRGNIPVGDLTLEVESKLYTEHLYSNSSANFLRNKRRALVVGHFELNGTCAEVHPIIIGDMIFSYPSGFPQSWENGLRLYPSEIDCFQGMAKAQTVTATHMKELRMLSEDTVKHALAEIIGEPFVQRDWGGEKSDLQTNNLRIGGKPASAAFLLKGPAVPGELHPDNLGKRGDQLVRLFDEPADILIVQHCNKIANTIVRQAEALTADAARPRRYCIIDGADTYRILKAYGKLGAG